MSLTNDEGKAQDVHFKMSKKIAQLTKVIYQLNCRNEDGDAYSRSVADRYEEEIATIMGEARSKISTLRDELAAKNESKKLESMVKELSRQHDKERDAAMKELDTLKRGMLEREADAKRNFDERMQSAAKEVAKAKEDFSAAIRDIRNASSNATSELDEYRRKKEEEMDALVKEYNERYKAMLAQQMDEQDQLERRLNEESVAKIAAMRSELEGRIAALTQAIGDANAKASRLAGDLESSTAEAATQRSVIAALEAEIAARSAREAGLNKGSEALTSELEAAVARAKTAEAEVAKLVLEINALNETQVRMVKESVQLADRVARLVSEGTDKDNEISSLTTANKRQEEELAQLRRELGAVSASGNDAQQAHQARNKALSDELAGERAAHIRTQGLLKGRQDEKAALEREYHLAKEAWLKEASAMRDQFDAERAAAMNHASGNTAALTAQHEKAMAELRNSLLVAHDKETSQLKSDHAKEMNSVRLDAQAELQRTSKEAAEKHNALQLSNDQLNAKLAEMEASRNKLASQLSGETGALQRDLEAAQRETSSLNQQLRELEKLHAINVADASAAAEIRLREELQAAKADYDAQFITLTHNAAAKLADAESRHQKTKADLEAELERIRRSHMEEMGALNRQHTIALEGALNAHSKDANAQREAANAKLRAEMQASFSAEKAALVASHNEALSALNKLLVDERAARATERQSLESQLALLRTSSLEASSGLEAKCRDMESAMVALREELHAAEASFSRQLHASHQEHQTALTQIKGEWEGRLSDAQKTHESKLDALSADARAAQRDMDENYKSRIANLERRKDEERTSMVAQVTADFGKQLADLKANTTAEIAELQNANKTLTNEVRALTTTGRDLTKQLDDATRLYHAEEERVRRADMEREHTAKQHQDQIAEMRQLHEYDRNTALAAAHDQHAKELESLRATFEVEREELNAKIKKLRRTIADLEYKYANRESRAEDVEKINGLLRDLREKDEALLKAFNDMKFYKLELVNREESYNKVFGRQPNIAGAAADGKTVAPSSAPSKGSSSHPDVGGRTRVKSLK